MDTLGSASIQFSTQTYRASNVLTEGEYALVASTLNLPLAIVLAWPRDRLRTGILEALRIGEGQREVISRTNNALETALRRSLPEGVE